MNMQMRSDCRAVRYLQRFLSPTDSPDPSLASTAQSVLRIAADIESKEIVSATDLRFLRELLEALCREGLTDLVAHLRTDAPDCEICAALAGVGAEAVAEEQGAA